MLEDVINRFNQAATDLQTTEFRRPRSPDEWQRMAKDPAARDYAKLIDAVVPLLGAYGTANMANRSTIAPKLNSDAQGILRIFASTMSVLAVRRKSPELIEQGLMALAILGEIDDVRDLTFSLCTLHHSATKLGMDTQKLFGDMSSMVPSVDLQIEMRQFPLRAPKDRDLAAFGIREAYTKGGFDLVQDNWRF